jgi:hypothetical protein
MFKDFGAQYGVQSCLWQGNARDLADVINGLQVLDQFPLVLAKVLGPVLAMRKERTILARARAGV